MIGLFSGSSADPGLEDVQRVAQDTGAVSAEGRPLVFDIGSRGERLDTSVIEGVRTLIEEAPMDIDVFLEDGAGDDFDATRFVTAIEAVRAEPPGGAMRRADRFDGVHPGTRVVFRIHLKNDLVSPTEEDQSFTFRIVLRGDGIARLKETIFEVVVPGRAGDGCQS